MVAACAHAPAPRGDDLWQYEVDYRDGALDVQAYLPPGSDELVVLEAGEYRHVSGLRATLGRDDDDDGGPASSERSGQGWRIDGCRARGCTLHYRYDLRASAREGARAGRRMANMFDGRAEGSMYPTSPARWLLRPERARADERYRFRVRVPAGSAFVTGVTRATTADTYEAAGVQLASAPYSAFGELTVHTYSPLGGAEVQLARPAGLVDDAALRWVERAIDGLTHYSGRFPVAHAAIILVPTDHDGVYFGAARGNGGASIQVLLGRDTDRATFEKDWVLVHEMVHLGFPNLPTTQRWLEEGLATYLETIIRTRLGLRTEEALWSELGRNLPQGLLAPADGGYNRSRSWAHMYWGGALFCFLADVEIRARTGGARSLVDVVRAIQAAGGTIETRWSAERVIAVGDQATGVPVLAELWRELAEGDAPEVDLDATLGRLGVSLDARGKVTLDDSAPWAELRRAITTPF